jgi:Ca-activated chloride channel family protein
VAILLLSDGANTDGRVEPLAAARNAARAGIPIYTIALGTADGVLELPGPQPGGRWGAPRQIRVPPDEATLMRIAELTGGRFFSAPSARDLQEVYQQIGSQVGFEYERQEVTFAFAAAGAILFAAGGALALLWFHRFP